MHAVELRVRRNDPAAADGLIEGWPDGEKVTSLSGVRIRAVPTLHADGVAFDLFFRGHGHAPAHEVEATFDNLVLSTGYFGPASPAP